LFYNLIFFEMKKLVYLAMVAFAASMVACGGNKAENAEAPVEEAPAAEEVVEAAVEEVVDSANAAVDTVAAAAAEVVE